jgi:acetylornithine deacetylase/succinyl-diaminopimelate desuccinylase-like protein
LTEGQDGKLFGLGSSDTKGNIAVLLTVLKRLSAQLPIAVLIYVDEEYEFLGMKKFVSSPLSRSINPKAVLSVDGSGGKIGRGCRGVIEVEAELTGKAGHSANPNSGINAIERFLQVQGDLAEIISEYDDPFLGNSTLNVAGIEGGTFAVGNVIPDRVKVLLEVRTSTSQLDAVKFINLLTECSRERQLEVGDVDVKLDFGAFSNNSSFPANIQRVLKEELNIQTDFLNASQFGYLDLQMLSAVYPDTQLLSYGIGEEGQAHQADEFITKESILLGLNTFPIVIKSCLSNA